MRMTDEVVERWLRETRTIAQAIASDSTSTIARRMGAVLQQAATIVELVRDGYAIDIHIGGREIVRAVRTPP